MEENNVLYLVVPCFNEEEVLYETTSQLSNLLKQLAEDGKVSDKSKILYVDDGSKDKTTDIIEELHKTNSWVNGVILAGNVGHQNALIAGLNVSKEHADIIVSIDADLQDDINVIPEMIDKYKAGADIVYGVRRKRDSDTVFKRATALAFYKLMRSMGANTVYNHADFRLMSKRAVEELSRYNERNLFIRGIVPLIGYKTKCVYYDRSERLAGESKYPFIKMVNFAIDGITSFSVKPVRMVFGIGMIFILASFLILMFVLNAYFTHRVVPGWSSIMLSIWFCDGCVLVGLGVIGEYISKIYLEAKRRPRYNIERIII